MQFTKLIVTICLVFIAQVTIGQVYQLMPQYGYQAPRMAFDSTIQIPTFCGVPTLKSVQFVNKKGAIAFDSCNNRFYTYNPKTLSWSQVSGGGGSTDTTSLSNRINLKIDSIKSRNDSVFAYKLGTAFFQYKDTTIGTLQSVTNKGNTTTNDITANSFTSSGGAIVSDDGSMTAQSYEFLNNGGSLQSIGVGVLWKLPNYSDTLVGESRNIDSVKRRTDSVFAYRNGTEVFQYKDSVGDTASVVIAKVHNATGTILQRGEVVYLSGASGDVASVKRANNKQDSTSSKTLGIVRRDIAIGGTGFVTTQGQIEKLNLGSFTAGDILWLDSIDGQFTKVVPQAPYHSVFIGVVERANNGNGLAYVKPMNGFELSELHDVQINGKLNNQVLVYSDTQKVWKNRSIYTIVDTTSLSSRINQKLSASDTLSLSSRINLKFNTSDTSNLQQKSLPSYSIMGNGTSAQANAQSIYYKDTSGSYTESGITWNGTAPTTLTATYRWTRIGKKVDLSVTLVYGTAGTSNSTLIFSIPADAPTPNPPTGVTGNSQFSFVGTAQVNATNLTTLTGSATRCMIRKNSGGTGFEFSVGFSPLSAISCFVQITYYTN
jgi:hypothetical protein